MDANRAGETDEGSTGQGSVEEARLERMSLEDGASGGEEEEFCSVCYDPVQYPIKLPCNHVFCFLCIKGAHAANRLCPMCRDRIPNSFILNPELISANKPPPKTSTNKPKRGPTSPAAPRQTRSMTKDKTSEKFWCYESKRDYKTWWKYDQRTSTTIEEAYQKWVKNTKKQPPYVDLQITGKIYRIDFESREQYLSSGDGRRRLIKRSTDLADKIDKIVGTAGIKYLK